MNSQHLEKFDEREYILGIICVYSNQNKGVVVISTYVEGKITQMVIRPVIQIGILGSNPRKYIDILVR